MADLQKLVDELSSLTVLEAAELSKLLEEKWGVSAAAPVAAAAAAPAAAGRRRPGRGADRVHRHPGQGRRQEDQRHQGGPHHHRARPEGGQGSGRGRAEAGEGRRRTRTRPPRSRRCSRMRAPPSRSSSTIDRSITGRAALAAPRARPGSGCGWESVDSRPHPVVGGRLAASPGGRGRSWPQTSVEAGKQGSS